MLDVALVLGPEQIASPLVKKFEASMVLAINAESVDYARTLVEVWEPAIILLSENKMPIQNGGTPSEIGFQAFLLWLEDFCRTQEEYKPVVVVYTDQPVPHGVNFTQQIASSTFSVDDVVEQVLQLLPEEL